MIGEHAPRAHQPHQPLLPRPSYLVFLPRPPYLTFLPHLAYLALFALLTVAITRPLATAMTTGIIGAPGDNLSFVWNFWWANTAAASRQWPFWTPALFAPIGTSLATHTFVPLMSLGAAVLFPHGSPLALYNGSLLLAVFLNFACAYAAAVTVTRDRIASAYGAIAFGAAPFLGVRLEGHLSVLSAWGLPLAFALTTRWLRRPSLGRTLAVPVALAAVAYTDYYYFIFASIMVALLLAFSRWDVTVSARPLTPRRTRIAAAVIVVLALVVVAIAAIAATGGTDTPVGGIRLRMTDTFNARVIAGFLALALAAVWKWPAVRAQRIVDEGAQAWPAAAGPVAFATLVVLLLPLLVASFATWRAGDYSTQTYVWRNAPPGIDVASFALGNQLHPLTGAFTRDIYRRFGINGIEGAAWPGIAPTILVALAWPLRRTRWVRTVFAIGAFFLVWSLGPYLRVLNYNTGLMLPQTLARFVPVLANARIPGRAFVVVQLAAALLGAAALSSLRGTPARRAPLVLALAFGGLLVDYVPSARHVVSLEVPHVYATLRGLPPGPVLELPFGIRDGFGEHGSLDHRVLFYQTVHAHPEMGGFVARLSPKTEAAFERDPVMGSILRLSAHQEPGAPGACQSSLVCRTRYVVINEQEASPALQAFAAGALDMRRIESSDGLTLFSLEHVPACSCR